TYTSENFTGLELEDGGGCGTSDVVSSFMAETVRNASEKEIIGKTPCMFLSLKAEMVGKGTEKEVMEYCRGKMSGYMVPKTVVFKEDLSKTSTGKIQKFVLHEMAKSMDQTVQGSSRDRKRGKVKKTS
ncbi:probable acyl-activating enzyme 5, peroxisomal, partial [Tanacetum coccineum]